MKHYRKQIICLFGAIAVFAYLSIVYFPKPKEESIAVMEEVNQDQLQIYVLDQDNTLIPMSKPIDAGKTIEEKLTMMVEAMCADQVKDEFTGVLGTGTKLEKVSVEDSRVSLYFNDQFATYEPSQELRVLEALTWGATQFPEIKDVFLYYKGDMLEQMPLAHTPIPNPLNRSLGINHFESASASLSNSDTITVFYTKEVAGTMYYVPKSKRIEGNHNDMETVVKEVLKDVSVSSSLSSPLYQDNIDIADLPRKEGDKLIVNMSNTLLSGERTAKEEAYEALVLSLSTEFDVAEVQVMVDDNVISLHGSNEEALSVSAMRYNPIPF